MVTTRVSGRLLLMLGIVSLFLPWTRMVAESASGTGIEGTARIGPIHGGPAKLGEPDSAPLANAILRVETAAGTIKTIATDEKGHFKVELPPGRYSLRAERAEMKGHGCAMEDIEVAGTGFKHVDLQCDTGMR